MPGDGRKDLPILAFRSQAEWAAWLDDHHGASPGVWLRLAKKGSNICSVSYDEAVEAALCYGWIDGQKKSGDQETWLQKFTPRAKRSIWSRVNREKALGLIAAGRMKSSGLEEVERATRDGRWDAAYDSPRQSTVPDDFQFALDASPRAKAFFSTLERRNVYAILFRIQTVKRADTRARRIRQFIEMLEKGERVHP